MLFVKKWGHEIALLVLTVWTAIGTDGQNGLISLLDNWISHHAKITIALGLVSTVVARLRSSPVTPPSGS